MFFLSKIVEILHKEFNLDWVVEGNINVYLLNTDGSLIKLLVITIDLTSDVTFCN